MTINPAAHQAHAYRVATPVYEGPLDLLLQLIERAELDITTLALAQVTDQYLAHLRQMQDAAPEEVSAFLVIAAKLIQIKSEALLPRPPVRSAGEEDPAEALARQLIAYKRFRQIADLLEKRQATGLRSFLRLASPPRLEGNIDLSDITFSDLLFAAAAIFEREQARQNLGTVVAPPRVTIREKIRQIAHTLRRQSHISFGKLLGKHRSRLDVIVTFLALLELVKRQMVNASQDHLFGEISIETGSSWQEISDQTEFELDFGE